MRRDLARNGLEKVSVIERKVMAENLKQKNNNLSFDVNYKALSKYLTQL